ncbi:MAG: hypothetical protein K8L99_33575 [Anaerolineae bacterium]|nr:hypothetical protein [Anaerolineae bacterium]
MPDSKPTEKAYRIALKAALVIQANGDVLDAMTGIAESLIHRGQTQEGANILAFVLNHPDVRYDTYDHAEDMFFEMEEHLCPRVIADARTFRLGKSIKSVAAYIDEQPVDSEDA